MKGITVGNSVDVVAEGQWAIKDDTESSLVRLERERLLALERVDFVQKKEEEEKEALINHCWAWENSS